MALVVAVSPWAAGCGDSVAEDGEESDPNGNAITNECGTYDPDDPNPHGIVANDPASPNIVDACDELCAKMVAVEGCSTDAVACRDTCRMRACNICPGKLEPLTRCKTEFFDASKCTCGDDGAVCELPADCEDEEIETGHCGG
jgi:hypothetical protein